MYVEMSEHSSRFSLVCLRAFAKAARSSIDKLLQKPTGFFTFSSLRLGTEEKRLREIGQAGMIPRSGVLRARLVVRVRIVSGKYHCSCCLREWQEVARYEVARGEDLPTKNGVVSCLLIDFD